jgi:putative restriction endonuclease
MGNMLDGAHIQPFAEFRGDRFVNGLALCKNHQWAFYHGWFGIDEDYRILISWDRFTEEAAIKSRSTKDFSGEKISLPDKEIFMPDQEKLKWHREIWGI